MIEWVGRYFPQGTKMSYPQGGFLLWVQLPGKIDTAKLNEQLTDHKISVAPGIVFTASNKYRHCLRLNYAQEPTDAVENAIQTIGETIRGMLSPKATG